MEKEAFLLRIEVEIIYFYLMSLNHNYIFKKSHHVNPKRTHRNIGL